MMLLYVKIEIGKGAVAFGFSVYARLKSLKWGAEKYTKDSAK